MNATDSPSAHDFWDEPDSKEDRGALILLLRRMGIADTDVLSAIERVPRRLFLNAPYQREAYLDCALPIDCGQTISAPHMVAMMTQALDIDAQSRILEIGTGSGYQAAILSQLAAEVYTIERYRALLELASQRFDSLRLTNIHTRLGDGFVGWPERAPFDRIIVTAAAPEIPRALKDQLTSHGRMIIPVGQPGSVQRLLRVDRRYDAFSEHEIAQVRFVPMVEGVAQQL